MNDHHDHPGTHGDLHNDLHSEQGALRGEHPGRAANPIIKVHDLAWLEFEKPDLARAEAFAHAFGFATSLRTADELHLRGTDAGAPCVIVRRGPRSRFLGAAFRAAEASDVLRLADATGTTANKLPETIGGHSGRPDRPERRRGSRRRGHARAPVAAGPDAAHVQLRPRAGAGQRRPSARRVSRRRCSGSATSCCRPRSTSRR